MKTKVNLWIIALAILSTLNPQFSTLHSQGTAFTYQGQLNDGGTPANGNYDLQFYLRDALTDGNAVGGTNTLPLVPTTNGLFTVSLDFGAGIFTGTNYWLEIGVRTNGSMAAYGTLTPRQQITPTPYAIFAGSASNVIGSISASQVSGSLAQSQLPAGVVTNGASGVNFSGTFSGSGAGISNLNLSASSSGTIRGPGVFAPPMTLPVGAFPLSVVAADVNGDGALDLISANFGDNSLTVLTNNGIGGFGFYATLSVGNEAESVAAADVNGDGKIDLICANYGAGTLSVLTNNGIGGFGSYATLSVGSGPFSVVAADVNGDGRPDLICANGSLTVFTNNGSGGFGLNATLNVGGAGAVVAADVNGDGKTDLICVNSGSATLLVLTNNGSGGFGLNATLNTGGTPYSVVAADVNGDGKPDLICSKANSGATAFTLVVFTNNGIGGFGSNTTLTVGRPPYWVTAADLNGDGKPDLISANAVDHTLTVLLNQTIFTGVFAGNGSGLTSLNAAQLTGSVPSATLTSVPAASLTGTVADTTLSANVALRAGGNTFTGAQIITNGSVGIGTASPDALLSVNGTADKPGGGSWTTFSDGRLKDVGADFIHGMEALDGIQPVHYHYKSDNPLKLPSQPDYVGVVAQQVQSVIPEAVQRNKDGYLVVNNDPIIWTMFNAIKELNQKNETDVKAKDAEILGLKARLEKLEQLMNAKTGAAK